MKLQSKIRSMFSSEMLDLIASICDTRRIDSYARKMKVLRDLLYTNGIKFDVLGGATNRIAMFIDGYAVKFALDSQGYRDNFIEYSICNELQPVVTKSYETNGYVLVAECVRLMTESEFVARKQDILNILVTLADDYLLGDVGFLQKNRTNWGVRDNGELVILDYAYCHRATENLFTCPVCGEGVLTYTSDFDKLICTNRSVCHAVFTYNQRKREQGDQVDFDMIEERKSDSIVLREGENFVDVSDQNQTNGKIMFKNGKKVVVVDNGLSYQKMMEANKMISTQFDRAEALAALIQLSLARDGDSVAKETAIQNLDNLKISDTDEEYIITDDYQEKMNNSFEEEDIRYGQDDEDAYSLSYLISLASGETGGFEKNYDMQQQVDSSGDESFSSDADDESGLSYLISLSMKGDKEISKEEQVTTSKDIPNDNIPSNNMKGDEETLKQKEEPVNMDLDETKETVPETSSKPEKLELSSLYGEFRDSTNEKGGEPKVGMILDGEHL